MRRIAPVLALALVMTLAGGSVVLAAAASTRTTFRTNDEGSYVEYKGRVSSEDPRCIKNRVVQIFHNGILIAETSTDSEGKWEVDGPKPPSGDKVTAKVKAKKKRGRTICKGTSNTNTFVADN